ncbi:MAG: hypothetical protein GWN01_10300 [Nitrosopumilaceae archaeon]|nr:hypothetical protein [Nitrosopumilaceae archaeon]NIU87637.1 hypothetical protein [Nitrosopumilaceae archaeon]NIV66062.1 hypothetical protein [Nitrosopumilaceae archaeon]NIX61891.1 hypothetical protein [Nitrosopumilaceae archaeon]
MQETRDDTQATLNQELENLKQKTGKGNNLHVVWFPNKKSISGEVKNNIIFVYDDEKDTAVETLYHEFLEHTITTAIEPYKKLANKLIELFNEDAYTIKEETIEGITKLLSNNRK